MFAALGNYIALTPSLDPMAVPRGSGLAGITYVSSSDSELLGSVGVSESRLDRVLASDSASPCTYCPAMHSRSSSSTAEPGGEGVTEERSEVIDDGDDGGLLPSLPVAVPSGAGTCVSSSSAGSGVGGNWSNRTNFDPQYDFEALPFALITR